MICFAVSASAGNINTEPGCHNHLGESVPCLDSENISPRARAAAYSGSVCKNNLGEDVPCQTSEQHIKTWTESLKRSYGDIEKAYTPNSYWAVVYGCKLCPVNSYLDKSAKSFDELSPHLTFERNGKDSVKVGLKDLYKYGSFDKLVTLNKDLKRILSGAEKIAFIVHGYEAGNTTGCWGDWQTDMATKIRKEEGEKGVTVVVCWSSSIIESWTQLVFGRIDIGVSGMCLLDWTSGLSGYYQSATSTGKMGELLAGLMKAIRRYTSITYFHGIGHSLGAHIMGNVYNFGHFKMDRISGLDPAGPCFGAATGDITIKSGSLESPDTDYKLWGLTKHAAHFVDNIHTDGTYFGSTISKGHLNVFAGPAIISIFDIYL